MSEIELMIQDCIKRQSKLSEWELNFIDSISHRYEHTQHLTVRQQEILNKIWERLI